MAVGKRGHARASEADGTARRWGWARVAYMIGRAVVVPARCYTPANTQPVEILTYLSWEDFFLVMVEKQKKKNIQFVP